MRLAWITIDCTFVRLMFRNSKNFYKIVANLILISRNFRYFEKQLELADKFNLPVFLHCRAAHDDLVSILERNKQKVREGGVVHTFDGTLEQAKKFIAMGFHIGINGCSLKTESNLEVIKEIPNDKILIETDCPWCEIREFFWFYK